MLEPILFLINRRARRECAFSKFADHIPLGGNGSFTAGQAAIQKDIGRLERVQQKSHEVQHR